MRDSRHGPGRGSPPEGETASFRFGEFWFDGESGELRSADDGTVIERLPPQPASLLTLLVRRSPEIVSIDEIRDTLWPDVLVDFDKSLHSCVRKVRSALGDSASSPEFVETVPRRRYRFIAPLLESSAEEARGVATAAGKRVLVGFACVLALAVVVGSFHRTRGDDRIRVGVMPFEPAGARSALARGNDLAESLVARLVELVELDLDVIGPTTTSAFEPGEGLTAWMKDAGIDYLINGRETSSEGEERVLVEIIRGGDGAHVWTRYLDDFARDVSFAATVEKALLRALERTDDLANERG